MGEAQRGSEATQGEMGQAQRGSEATQGEMGQAQRGSEATQGEMGEAQRGSALSPTCKWNHQTFIGGGTQPTSKTSSVAGTYPSLVPQRHEGIEPCRAIGGIHPGDDADEKGENEGLQGERGREDEQLVGQGKRLFDGIPVGEAV